MKFAIAANAGWYTMPDGAFDWPYSLDNAPDTPCSLQDWFEQTMVILLGDLDTDPHDGSLRRTPEAMAQGPYRFARGIKFLEAARQRADELNVPLAWRSEIVGGVAHDNAGMAIAAAAIIAESSFPAAIK